MKIGRIASFLSLHWQKYCSDAHVLYNIKMCLLCVCFCSFSTLQCVCNVYVSPILLVCTACICVFVCVGESEILRYLALLLPLFVWLQAFRLSVRGLCSETKHAVISVTSLAAGTQHIHLSETRCYGAACNSPHFGSSNWHLGPQSLWGYWKAMKHSSVEVFLLAIFLSFIQLSHFCISIVHEANLTRC